MRLDTFKNITRLAVCCLVVALLCGIGLYIRDYYSAPPKSESAVKVAHLSIDDVMAFEDLINNGDSYESLFDHPLFAFLYDLHRRYGAVFTLYTYDTFGNNGSNIASVPLKFRDDFLRAAPWLRIGFHWVATEFNADISVQDFQSAYGNVNRSVCKFADSTMVADVLRLHDFYSADSLTGVLGGTRILLCADRPGRRSYTLDDNECRHVSDGHQLVKDGIRYLRTDLRTEYRYDIDMALRHIQDRDTLVIFTHEWALTPQSVTDILGRMWYKRKLRVNSLSRRNLETTVKWLNDNGYRFSFL